MRKELRRSPNDEISWKKLRGHPDRLRASQMLGQANPRMSSVIVCKRDFHPLQGVMPDEDFAYLYTFRFLLERLSWLARDYGLILAYTLAQIGRFRLGQLRGYEAKLRSLPDCSVHWPSLDPSGGSIDQPKRLEYLQLADIAASAIAQAFEPDPHGNVEPRYAQELQSAIYRHGTGRRSYTSYGMKMHPWNAKSRAAHDCLTRW
jgi:hypothetical protein